MPGDSIHAETLYQVDLQDVKHPEQTHVGSIQSPVMISGMSAHYAFVHEIRSLPSNFCRLPFLRHP